MAEQLPGIVASEPERLATGFEFTEGPLWHPDGYWLFVDIRTTRVYRLEPGGAPEVFRENSGGSNGLTLDRQGGLILCEGDNRQLTRREADGSYTPIATHVDGKRINRPNDVVGRSDGSLYFTDPAGRLTRKKRSWTLAASTGLPPTARIPLPPATPSIPTASPFPPTRARCT